MPALAQTLSHRPVPWLVALALAPSAAPAASASAAECAGSRSAPRAGALPSAAKAVVCQINRARASRGLQRVGEDARLAAAGGRHARHMVRRGYFSHVSPEGRTMAGRLRSAGYLDADQHWAAAELLAWGTGGRATPAATVAAWMASPPHRRVLLSPRYRDVGVGIAIGTPSAPARRPAATYAAELGAVE